MGSRIRELRIKRGINQEILAQAIGITQQTVSKLENQRYNAPLDLIINIARYFEVTVDYLLELTEFKRSWEEQQNVDEKLDEYYEHIKLYEELNESNKKTLKIIMERLREAQSEMYKGDK